MKPNPTVVAAAEAPSLGPAAWSRFLSEALGRPVQVTFGRARRQVLVARPQGEGWVLRLNEGFREAPPEVRAAVAAWMANGRRARRATAVLDAWIEELGHRIATNPKRLPPLRPAGSTHDLAPLFERMREEALDPGERARLGTPALTFGRATRRARRSLQLGSYEAELDLIRVHPVLDQGAVPAWFVRFLLFHEALHALLPPRPGGSGRTLHHPPEFRARERRHPDQQRADAWQTEHIAALLRSVRTGRPLPRPRQGGGPMRLLQRLLFDAPDAVVPPRKGP